MCKHNFNKISNIVKIKVTKYPSVANLVKRTLCVSATSDRVFCHGSIIVRSHRSSLAPERLHKILFFKCSEHVFDASELLLLVSPIKYLFLLCMNNYSQKMLIDHGFMASKKLFQTFIKNSANVYYFKKC